MLGEEHAAADLADLVAGAADALEGAGDAGRRLDLDDEVDGAHVDAELEAAGGDDAGEPPALQVVLDQGTLLLGDRAVVGLRDDRGGAVGSPRLGHDLGRCRAVRLDLDPGALGGDLVQPGREPLGEAAGVGEDDGRAVLLDQVGHVVLDVGPDRGGLAAVALGLVGVVVRRGRGHVLDRDHDLEVPLLGRGRRDDLDRRRTAEEARDLLERPHRGGEPDPLRRLGEQGVEALEAEPEVGAALGAGHGVDLVDDHGLDVAQALAGLAGQHQEQRLGGRDQDVGRRARQRATLRGRGVTRPDADTDLGQPGARGARRSAGCRRGATAGCARRRRRGP